MLRKLDGFTTVLENINDCCGCSACRNACTQNCIEMTADVEGFLYPRIDQNKCVDCGLCLSVCPILNRQKIVNNNFDAFIVRNRDKQLRFSSTAGGAFPAIAAYILSMGGGYIRCRI